MLARAQNIDHVNNANNFLAQYEAPLQLNKGINLYFIHRLMLAGVIKLTEPLDHSLQNNLEQIDFRHFKTNNEFNVDAYIHELNKAIPGLKCQKEQLRFMKEKILTFMKGLAPQENYEVIGKEEALLASCGITRGNEDVAQSLPKPVKYRFDQEFQHWPINKIGTQPVYAALGPVATVCQTTTTNGRKTLYPAGFFYELLNWDQHNTSDIDTIVALGYPAKDFDDYFTKAKNYAVEKDGGKYSITVSPNLVLQDRTAGLLVYKLLVSVFDQSNHHSVSQKQFDLFNVQIKDGCPLELSPDYLTTLHDALAKKIKMHKGIVVHCHSGWGRTGQLIAETIWHAENKSAEIFATPDHDQITEKLRDFVSTLRSYRHGLILQSSQFYSFIKNSLQYDHVKLARSNSVKHSPIKPEHSHLPSIASLSAAFFSKNKNATENKRAAPEVVKLAGMRR